MPDTGLLYRRKLYGRGLHEGGLRLFVKKGKCLSDPHG